jgi:hypothetical protein
MIYKKLTSLAVATVVGAALIAAPAQARFGGGFGGGGFHGGGFGGGFVRGPGFGGGFARGGFIGRPGFIGRSAFFPGRWGWGGGWGVGAIGLGALAASSCWTLVPTAFGWQQVWACNSGWGGGGWGWGGWGGY